MLYIRGDKDMMIVGGKWYICRVHWDSALCRGAGTTRKKWEEGSLPQRANIIVGESRCSFVVRLFIMRLIIDLTIPQHSTHQADNTGPRKTKP